MSKGDYVVYERASRGEEGLFLEAAKEVVDQVEEPGGWRRRGSGKHPRGRKTTYGFRTMLLILLLKVYHRKEYREMESHLNNDPHLLRELGLERAPGKSTIQRAAAKMSLKTLLELNDAVVARFKKTAAPPRRSM